MKYLQFEHPTVLDPKPGSPGFIVGDSWKDQDMVAAIPVIGSRTQLAIIQHGSVVKYCRNFESAKNYVNKLRKNK
jgi:hypothetical protein